MDEAIHVALSVQPWDREPLGMFQRVEFLVVALNVRSPILWYWFQHSIL